MPAPDPKSRLLRPSELSTSRPTAFDIRPDATEMADIARTLGLSDLRKLRFTGEIAAMGQRDWQLTAHLGATVEQPSVATLEPVRTRIDESVIRRFVADLPEPESAEVEMPEDDTLEPLRAEIDLDDIMREALALCIPDYPRKEDEDPVAAVFTEPGKAPLTDDDLRPFAGLADLRDKLAKREDDDV